MEQVPVISLVTLVTAFLFPPAVHGSPGTEGSTETRVAIGDARWTLNGRLSYRASQAEGLLMNVRRVNATFEDRHRPNFDAERNTDAVHRQDPRSRRVWHAESPCHAEERRDLFPTTRVARRLAEA